MQRSRLGQLALASAAVLAATMTAGTPAVAATDSDIPTFSQFHAQTFKDVDQQYIVNGDEPVSTTSDLKDFYESMVGSPTKTTENGLVVNTVGGVDDKWSASPGQEPHLLREHQVRQLATPTSSTRWRPAPGSGRPPRRR